MKMETVHPVVPSERTGGNRHKLKYRFLHLGKHFFTMQTVNRGWHRLAKELI